MNDLINYPPHYRVNDTYECIRVIEAWNLGFCLGNVVKYISRCELKGSPIEDLKKARWYLDREIVNREQGIQVAEEAAQSNTVQKQDV